MSGTLHCSTASKQARGQQKLPALYNHPSFLIFMPWFQIAFSTLSFYRGETHPPWKIKD